MSDDKEILPETLPNGVTALIRQAMNTAGTALASYGLITGQTAELIVGAGMACIPYIWSWTRARLSKRIVAEAVAQKQAAVQVATEEVAKTSSRAAEIVAHKISDKLQK